MPDDRIGEFPATVDGAVRGREVRGDAIIRVGERGIAIVLAHGELRLPYGRLEGWQIEHEVVTLAVNGGEVVRVTMDRGARPFAAALAMHACVLPELTRGLRALGSSRSRADAAQASLFAPLLSARRRAARLRDPEGRVQALDADVLDREIDSALRSIAAARVRQPGAERRALGAALEDAVMPLRAALRSLGAAAAAYERTPEARRLAAWREWTEAARRAFAAADAAWPLVRRELEAAPRPPAPWRRWMGSGR